MTKEFHSQSFDESTKLKLEIFRECFREWLPVFINNQIIKRVYIYDFFAGPGKDAEENRGSPLILLNEAKGRDKRYCNIVNNDNKEVAFIFIDRSGKKTAELENHVEDYFSECKRQNCCEKCVYIYEIKTTEFKILFENDETKRVFSNPNFAKFALLDQCGLKEVDPEVFLTLVNSPRTDFIFFVSSDSIKRFKSHPNTIRHIDTDNIDFDENKPKECHRSIAKYYRNLIPEGTEYYLHHFSLKKGREKGANIYGLIFGTNHTLGMEKFLKVCWKHDKYSGESNFNIDNDWTEDTLFHRTSQPNKKQRIISEIEGQILHGEITDNITGLKYALRKGWLPVLFTEVVKDLEKQGKIYREGEVNNASTNIHKVQRYTIHVISDEND